MKFPYHKNQKGESAKDAQPFKKCQSINVKILVSMVDELLVGFLRFVLKKLRKYLPLFRIKFFSIFLNIRVFILLNKPLAFFVSLFWFIYVLHQSPLVFALNV